MLSPRRGFFLGLLFCLAVMATAYFMQFVMELEPCPLCITQRLFMIAVGGVFLLGFLHDPGPLGQRFYALLAVLFSLGGAAVAARHVWLQSLPPDQVPACGPSLDYVWENFPLSETLKLLFSGTGDCAEVEWELLGLTIPSWSLLTFLLLAVWSLAIFASAREVSARASRALL